MAQVKTQIATRLIDIKELSQIIGKAPQTIRNEMSDGRLPIPHVKIGGSVCCDTHTTKIE